MRYVRESSGLVRSFRWWDVLFITVAGPTGSGILFYAVQTSSEPGGSIVLAFAIGMALFLPVVVASAVLVSMMPRSGGPYVGVSRILHPSIAYLGGCLLIIGDGIIIGVLGFILMEIGGAMLSVVGQAYHLEWARGLGGAISGKPGAPIGAVAWVVLFWFIMLRPPAVFRKILATLLLLPMLTTVLCIVVFYLTPPAEATTAFNHVWGAGIWERIPELAAANGWQVASFSWTSTLGLLLVVVWAFNGVEVASYAGGEVQAPQRSYFKGLLLGWLAVGLLYMVTAAAVEHSFGNITEPYHFLQANHPNQLAEIMSPTAPSIPFYLMCILRNPALGVFLAFAFTLWFAKIIPVIFLTSSRLMFAMSMDRLLPAKLAQVNPITTVPTWAIHATGVIGLAGAGFYFFNVGTVLGTLMFCTQFLAWTMGLALIIVPFRYPDLLRPGRLASPRMLGLPPVSWLGIVTLASGLVLLYLAGSVIPGKVWIGLLVVVLALMGNFLYRTRRIAIDRAPAVEAGLLPPE